MDSIFNFEEFSPTNCIFWTWLCIPTCMPARFYSILTRPLCFLDRQETSAWVRSGLATRTGVARTVARLQNTTWLMLGIPHGSRARQILFLYKTLVPDPGKYPAIGQKKLSGAASRLMIYFAETLSEQIAAEWPSDVHTPLLVRFLASLAP